MPTPRADKRTPLERALDNPTLADYETYTSCLAESGDKECAELATFLEGRISEIIRR